MWSHHSSNLKAQSLYFFSPEFPVQPVITWHPSPPLCLVGQEAEQLRRTVRSLASGPEPGCVARRRDDCVSTCWPLCFLTGDLLNGQWQIYVSCYFSLLQEGIRKTRDSVTMGPPLQASKQTPKVSSTTLRVAQRHIQPVGRKTSRWPCDPVGVGFSEWWLQIWEVGGVGGLDDEEILRKPLLISDALDELWWVEGRGGWDGDGVAGGGQGGGWRVAEVILLIYGFSTFSSCEDYRVYTQHRRGRRDMAGVLKRRGGHAPLIHDLYD